MFLFTKLSLDGMFLFGQPLPITNGDTPMSNATKTSNIIDRTNGAWELVASGLTFVDATNQAMTLEWQLDGSFVAVRDDLITRDAYDAYQRVPTDWTQGGWAFL